MATLRQAGAYATGWLPSSGLHVPHPGGIDLTLRTIQLAGLRFGSRILDVGCGGGDSVLLLRAHEYEAYGIDRDPHPRDEAASQFCRKGVAERLDFVSRSFDGVLIECSLSLMRAPQRVLQECARVLCPGGKLMISDLYVRNPAEVSALRALQHSCISGVLVREELECWIEESGLALSCFEDHSKELRETTARYIFEHDSLSGLWGSTDDCECEQIAGAMRRARAGYFVLVAVQTEGWTPGKRNHHGR